MKRVSVQAHLLTLLASWLAALSLVAWIAIAGLRMDRRVVFDLAQNHMPSIQALQLMKEAYTAIRLNNLTTSIYETDHRAAASVRDVLETRKLIWARFSQGWHDYALLPREKKEDSIWRNFEKAHETYRAAELRTAESMMRLAEGGYSAHQKHRLFQEFYRRYREAEEPVVKARCLLDELALFNLSLGTQKANSAMAIGAEALKDIFLTSILVAVFSLTFGSTLVFRLFREFEDRIRLEQALKIAVETRDEFLSVASHDLKNTLNSLGLQTELLNKSLIKNQSQVGEPALTLSRDALRLLRKLGQMLDQLLDVTRIRVGALQLEPVNLDLRALLIETVDAFREAAEKQGSSISLNAPAPATGRWDPVRIHQIVSNLLSNAVKYGGGKPIEVTLECDAKIQMVRLKVKDHGPGIPKEIQAKIFEQFQRASQENHIEGLGLGLYIVRKIVAAHGGSISLESAPGSGAEFTVELPLKAEILK